ncbi:MAG: hypothetical protein JO112_01360 [Planctomycetes bacterium]|nr:hypothetical protein [Planctomycetota bacterium]
MSGPVYPSVPMTMEPPQWAAPPGAWAPTPPPAMVQQPAPRPPTVRGMMEDEPSALAAPLVAPPRPSLLKMPSPQQLGLAPAKPEEAGEVDWTTAHQRLKALGAVCFNLVQLPQGGCRFTCLLPTNQPNRSHRIEAQAASEGEAVRLALDQAETWAAGR